MAPPPRPYDIVVFGATGDAGSAVARYLGKHGGAGLKWALAGRDAGKLERLKASEASLRDVPTLHAEVHDAASMGALAESCAVLLTAAGPYARVGRAVVCACVAAQTHYVDVTGEVHWVAEMAKLYEFQTKSTFVSFAGYDCVPDEASLFATARALREPLAFGECVCDYGAEGGGPRGTVLTVLGCFQEPLRAAKGWAAFMGLGTGCRAAAARDLAQWALPHFSATLGCFTVPNFMGAIQIPVVHRSGHDNGWVTPTFRFKDRMVVPPLSNFARGSLAYYLFVVAVFLVAPVLGLCVLLAKVPVLEASVRRRLEQRTYGGSDAAKLSVTATGVSASGRSATATLTVVGDAGIVATAALCAEVALCMVECKGTLRPGFTTPVGALGDRLLLRIERAPTMTLDVKAL